MTYVFDEERREMPVREVGWSKSLTAGTVFLAILLAGTGVVQWRHNLQTTAAIVALAGQQVKTAERVRVLERQNPLGLRMVGQDSTGQAIWIRPKHRNISLPVMSPDSSWGWP